MENLVRRPIGDLVERPRKNFRRETFIQENDKKNINFWGSKSYQG